MQPPALEILQAGAEDRQGLVRAEAVRALAAASGSGPDRVLPVFEAMLRASDPATRRMGALALGDVTGAPDATAALLAGVLHQRGESVRAAAAEALARIAQRDPKAAGPLLEQAIGDPAHDVRATAIRGLGTTWARQRKPAEVAEILETCETDSARRLVAVEALVISLRGWRPWCHFLAATSHGIRGSSHRTAASAARSSPSPSWPRPRKGTNFRGLFPTTSPGASLRR